MKFLIENKIFNNEWPFYKISKIYNPHKKDGLDEQEFRNIFSALSKELYKHTYMPEKIILQKLMHKINKDNVMQKLQNVEPNIAIENLIDPTIIYEIEKYEKNFK